MSTIIGIEYSENAPQCRGLLAEGFYELTFQSIPVIFTRADLQWDLTEAAGHLGMTYLIQTEIQLSPDLNTIRIKQKFDHA